jgi:large subunit ribosomal protein L19
MKAKILDKIDGEERRNQAFPPFAVGDTVKVSVRVKEGGKERVQAYTGTVIARKGTGARETFTVRRVTFGESVERVFPLHAPSLAGIEVQSSGKVRRAKLYFLRRRTGKVARLKMKNA